MDQTQDLRDSIRELYVKYDRLYFKNIKSHKLRLEMNSSIDRTDVDQQLSDIHTNITIAAEKLQQSEGDEYILTLIFQHVLNSYRVNIPLQITLLRSNYQLISQVIKETTSDQSKVMGKLKSAVGEGEDPEVLLMTLYKITKDRALYNIAEVRSLKKVMANAVIFFNTIVSNLSH